jgi:HNH endonuclease
MTITPKSIKILWSASAGLCAFPNCRQRLTFSEAGELAPYTLGKMAHICGRQPGTNRHNSEQTPQQRDDYQNLILLCPTHHSLIDRAENKERFLVEYLQQIKADHEAFVRLRLHPVPATDKQAIAREIAPLLVANHQVWLNYGPLSDFARKNPNNDAAYAVWLSERLGTIVPNNRRITEILEDGVHAFTLAEQGIISDFQLHARSYERWVADEIAYEGVVRFPKAFTDLIEETLNASI